MTCICENDKIRIPPEYLEMSVKMLERAKQQLYDKILEEKSKNNKYIEGINKDGTGGCRQKTIWFE